MNATANSGSMPPEHPAMIEIVPVGATVVRLQLRRRRSARTLLPLAARAHVASGPQIERSHSGKTPRSAANRSDSTFASSSTNCMTRPASSNDSSEPYAISSLTNMSAQPITPRPIRLIRCARSVISGSGYRFASITLSRKCVDVWTAWRSPSQSTIPSLTNAPKLIDPRLHTSKGKSGCSPHGFVAS